MDLDWDGPRIRILSIDWRIKDPPKQWKFQWIFLDKSKLHLDL